ncbi:MAG: ZIP family metal transporter [Bacteroidales bacterium]|jgi:ZIP family zinc transporter|nr:ZIP family metal transporter [Bacteroidales bacterium]
MQFNILAWVAGGTGFIFLMTCLGAATVFLFHKKSSPKIQTIFLGFAAGIMIAAAVFGLLQPAIESAQNQGIIAWLPAAGGFLIGVLFLFGLDKLIPHIHPMTNVREGVSSSMKRTTLLVSAVTLHNIPEGMAVGLAFALAAQQGTDTALYSALALAIGIGIQNFPEGAAVALPLRQEGISTKKSFFLGCISGVVEPVFGLLMILIAGITVPIMPWLLAFAAGAMLYVVVEELIPEAHLGEHSNIGTLSVMAGFLLMMILDVALG